MGRTTLALPVKHHRTPIGKIGSQTVGFAKTEMTSGHSELFKYDTVSASTQKADPSQGGDLVCSYCGTTFKTKTGLKEHVNKHEGVYRYYCEICGKGFMIKTYYLGHYNTHLKQQPYQCEVCQKTFAYKRSLLQHKCYKTRILN